MSWSISITQEGWQNIYDNLGLQSKRYLAEAIREDHHAKTGKKRYPINLLKLPHDVLVDKAYELIEENDTCDNGGWNAWIDKEGWYKVSISKKGEDDWTLYP
jgi:hypothetical protein